MRDQLRFRWLMVGAIVAILAIVITLSMRGQDIVSRFFTSADHTWASMQNRGVWRIGLDPSFPPFEMLDSTGAPIGFDVDLAKLIAGEWGMQTEVVALGFDSLLDAVATGKIDSAVSAMPYDPRATKDYAYSSPYFEAGVLLTVREETTITESSQLDGGVIAVEWGSMGDMVGRRMQREGLDVELAPYETPQDAVAALVDDPSIDALLVDGVTLRQAQGSGAAIKAVGSVLESNAYVIVMPIDATDLHVHMEEALDTLRADGRLAKLEDEWFNKPQPSD